MQNELQFFEKIDTSDFIIMLIRKRKKKSDLVVTLFRHDNFELHAKHDDRAVSTISISLIFRIVNQSTGRT